MSSRRRCCLCFYLENRNEVRKGQIAHINRNASDNRFDNLVWLCFEHHEEYDGKTSQSKGLSKGEIKAYRDKLYAVNSDLSDNSLARRDVKIVDEELDDIKDGYRKLRTKYSSELKYLDRSWRFPLWQIANQPELFAFKARNGADGICLIERIDLPDGRIVIVAIQMAGNPGISITNSIKELCHQVCERFEIEAHRLVWLEHYDADKDDEWRMVTFSKVPPQGLFEVSEWSLMTDEGWRDLKLRPKKRLIQKYGHFQSKIAKKFYWPTEAILE
jgi:hypothetical protein